MKKSRIIFLIILLIIIALSFAIVSIVSSAGSKLEKLADLPIAEVDLSATKDGVYTGSYATFPVSAQVRVTMSNHKIVSIDLIEHKHGQGTAAEIIPHQVVEAQSLQIDAVSGATYSSKVILKAIENALSNDK